MITVSSTPKTAGTIDPNYRELIDELAIESGQEVRLYVSKIYLELVFLRWHSITPEVLNLATERFFEIGWLVDSVHDLRADGFNETSGFCITFVREK